MSHVLRQALWIPLLFLGLGLEVHASEKFTSEEGRFTVRMPLGKVEATKESAAAGASPVDTYVFTSANAGNTTAFMVSYSDLPGAIQNPKASAELLATAVQATVGEQGKLLFEKTVRFKKMTGKELRCQKESFDLYSRIFLVGGRMYQLVVLGKQGTLKLSEVQWFFASFDVNN